MGEPSYHGKRVPTNSRIGAVAALLYYSYYVGCSFIWVGRGALPLPASFSGKGTVVAAFQPQPNNVARMRRTNLSRRNPRPPVDDVTLFASNSDSDPKERNAVVGSSSSLVTQSDASTSMLLSTFANLDLSDQYDAVLSSACAKILDDPTATAADQTILKLNDCQRLLEEMNQARVAASPRSMMALIDVRAYSS